MSLQVVSPNTVGANEVLNEDNYFVWEFNARMKLAKKGLMEHIDATKAPMTLTRQYGKSTI